jgi:hypothetical protein
MHDPDTDPLRLCNLHSPLSLRINAIVDDHVVVAVVFAKLSIELPTTGFNEPTSVAEPKGYACIPYVKGISERVF